MILRGVRLNSVCVGRVTRGRTEGVVWSLLRQEDGETGPETSCNSTTIKRSEHSHTVTNTHTLSHIHIECVCVCYLGIGSGKMCTRDKSAATPPPVYKETDGGESLTCCSVNQHYVISSAVGGAVPALCSFSNKTLYLCSR